jgi:hypothetical protein
MDSPRRGAPDSVKHLLESTASIETFVSTDFIHGEENFLPIAQGLFNSEPVTDIEFLNCDFCGSGLHFKSILQSKPNIRSLCVDNCYFSTRELSAENFIHLLRSPNSSLRSFEIRRADLNCYGFSPSAEFNCLLDAVEKSQLESFSIGFITDQAM